jgi:23S rRNA (adenine2030-N6)-methyltransferase
MNYRHAFHAGNFADVLKHLVLVACLDHLRLKEGGFLVADVFAGSALYDLTGEQAARSPEWTAGVGRVSAAAARGPSGSIPPLVSRWLEVLAQAGGREGAVYPGSPLQIAALLRPQDRAVLCELHPQEAGLLRRALADLPDPALRRAVRVEERDAWQAVRALLPPPQRRGLLLVDPPFEKPGEFQRLTAALGEALERFATGTVILWHADKDPDATARYRRHLAATGARLLGADLAIAAPGSQRGLCAAGVTIANPPHTLEAGLRAALPWLADVLAQGPGSGWWLGRISGSW